MGGLHSFRMPCPVLKGEKAMRICNVHLPDFGKGNKEPKADGTGVPTSAVQPSPSTKPQENPNNFLGRGCASQIRNLYKQSTSSLSDAVNKLRSGSSAKTSLKTPDASVKRGSGGTAGRLRSKFLRDNAPETKIPEKAPELGELSFEKEGSKSFAEEIAGEIKSLLRDKDSTMAAKETSAPSKNTESDATSSRVRAERPTRFREEF